MWIAVLGYVNLFPNLEVAFKGVFNRVLKNLRKASARFHREVRKFAWVVQECSRKMLAMLAFFQTSAAHTKVSPPAREPARPPGQSGQDGAQVRTTALEAGCKRASPSRCVLRSVTHLRAGFVTHVDVCYKDAFSRARGHLAPRHARRDDLRERKSPRCSRVSNAVSNAEISILQTRKTPSRHEHDPHDPRPRRAV